MFGLPTVLLGERTWKGYKEVRRRIGAKFKDAGAPGRARKRRLRPTLGDILEDRQLLATAGVDYIVSGYKWDNPARVTYSIAPDGVMWISGQNTLSSAFDARFGAETWRRELARALATWQVAANINIVPVGDGHYDHNAFGASQGDARFGDIRVGGVAMDEQRILAQTYYPPPMGSTAGGDVEINLSMNYGVGRDFDLFSVLLHETGHSLGLGHPEGSKQVMRAVYGGVASGLSDGDLEGVRAIYGARQVDIYGAEGYGKTASLPIDMSNPLATSSSFTAQGASLNAIGDVQWFSFAAPSYASGSFSVTASASNVSMLSPKVTIYDDAGNALGSAADPGRWSADATATVGSIVPGRRYYAAVTGASDDVFAVGAYNLTISVSGSPVVAPPTPPVVVPPYVPTPPVVVIPPYVPPVAPTPPIAPTPPPTGPIYPTTIVMPDRFEMNDTPKTAARLGRIVQATYAGLTLTTGDVDFYAFQAANAGVHQITAAGTVVQVINSRGRVVAQGLGSATVSATRNAVFTVRIQSPDAAAVADYSLNIAAVPPAPRRPIAPPRGPAFGARFPFARMTPFRQEAPAVVSAARFPLLRRAPV